MSGTTPVSYTHLDVYKRQPEGFTMIETPVRRVIVMTTLQLSNFIKLDAVDRIVGMPSTRFLFNEEMQSRLASGAAKPVSYTHLDVYKRQRQRTIP